MEDYASTAHIQAAPADASKEKETVEETRSVPETKPPADAPVEKVVVIYEKPAPQAEKPAVPAGKHKVPAGMHNIPSGKPKTEAGETKPELHSDKK
jgi:hypothetical protein